LCSPAPDGDQLTISAGSNRTMPVTVLDLTRSRSGNGATRLMLRDEVCEVDAVASITLCCRDPSLAALGARALLLVPSML
jgi:hypothetical protein